MIDFIDFIGATTGRVRLLIIIIGVFISIMVFNLILRIVKKQMLKKAKSKKQISNIQIFTKVIDAIFIVLILLTAFFSYVGSWTGLGIFIGLLTAALGFALQKPITGIAAWVMIVIKRPFSIGDRIILGGVKGEVYDISLSHIYLDEVGGLVDSEDQSGRTIMIPNYLLFEQNVINYNLMNDYVLGQILVDITYESNLDKSIKIAYDSTLKFVRKFSASTKKETKINVEMGPSAIILKISFFAPVKKMSEIKSEITQEILNRVRKEKDVEIAYPHTEVVFKDKKLFKK